MIAVGDLYRKLIAKHISPQAPKVPFYSSVQPKILREATDFGAQYWQDNLTSPVLFHAAARKLLTESKDCGVHLEIGPHSALSGPLRQTYSEHSTSVNYITSLIRGKDDAISFLEAIGQLHSLGVPISYPSPKDAQVLTDLPKYPWCHDRTYWSETRIMKNWRFRKHPPHDLLGLRTIEGNDICPTWRNELRLVDVPWLRDHCVGNNIIFPGACYVAMAGEAVHQIHDGRGFTVRNVEFSKAIVIQNDKPTEIATILRPQRLTSTLDGEWYEFQIVSYEGTVWNKNCSGLVRSGYTSKIRPRRIEGFHRHVSASRWYTTMSRVGLNYGPRFSGLHELTASVEQRAAAATILDNQEVEESSYPLHPSTIDMVFQSLTVATCQGLHRDFKTLFLPTFVEELYIADAAEKVIQVSTTASGKPGTVEGSSCATSGNDVVLLLKGFKGKALNDSGIDQPPELKTLQLQWKPHFDFLDGADLMTLKFDMRAQIKQLEKLYVLCAIEVRDALRGLPSAHPHLLKYRDWLDRQYTRFQREDYPVIQDSVAITCMNRDQRLSLIPQVYDQCQAIGAWGPATAIRRAYEQAVNVFEGRIDYLDVLLQDSVLNGVYDWYNNVWEFEDFMQVLGHTRPQMQILEIGAGTGGMTAKFLEMLKSDFGERLYLKYTFTDISSGFFVQAKERFRAYEAIEYKLLDISKDPMAQGFTPGEYDLIIASNVSYSGVSSTYGEIDHAIRCCMQRRAYMIP